MKGISAVLATVLIVVITVAIIGLAYGWATGLFKVTSEATETQVGGVTENLQKSVDIIAVKCSNSTDPGIYLAVGGDNEIPPQPEYNYLTFTIKNTGTESIVAGELTAFLDNNLMETAGFYASTDDVSVVELSVGEVMEFEYWGIEEHAEPSTRVLKIDAPAGAVEETVTCTPLVY